MPIQPSPGDQDEPSRRRIAIVTGSRADFGLLKPVMLAVATRPTLELCVIAAGSHLISPGQTFYDVKKTFAIADTVPMQVAGRVGRVEDAESTARGISRFTRSFVELNPEWVVVLGDRIEAFAAAAAASIGGWALAHLHGGDRAEGVADEAMRHAISKLAHLHLPASRESAERLIRMGEPPERVHLVGSPAVDDLAAIPPMSDEDYAELGSPRAVLLLHPIGRDDAREERSARAIIEALRSAELLDRTLALHPNHDPGRSGILAAISAEFPEARRRSHLPRERFVGLLKRVAEASGGGGVGSGGLLIGNSSSALIEAAALHLPVVDIGDRQAGRERAGNVVHAADGDAGAIRAAIGRAITMDRGSITHPYGDGRAGEKTAEILATTDARAAGFLRKRNAY